MDEHSKIEKFDYPYVVVEFLEDKTCEPAPSTWITPEDEVGNIFCWWPPRNKVTAYSKCRQEPDTASDTHWLACPAKVLAKASKLLCLCSN